MKLYYARDTNQIVLRPGNASALESMKVKARDVLPLEVAFVTSTGEAAPFAAGEVPVIKVALKAGLTESAFLALASTFTAVDGLSGVYAGELPLNTVPLIAALGNKAAIDAVAELTYSLDGTKWQSSGNIKVTINRDVVVGDEGAPTDLSGFPEEVAARVATETAKVSLLRGSQYLLPSEKAQVRKNAGVSGTIPGPFQTDAQARFYGLPPGAVYRKPDGSLAIVPVQAFTKIAFMGDSITVQGENIISGTPVNGRGNYMMVHNGYPLWVQTLLGQSFELLRWNNSYFFAKQGYTTTQIRAEIFPDLLAQTPGVVVMGCGANDSNQDRPISETRENWLYMIGALKAAGWTVLMKELGAISVNYTPDPGNPTFKPNSTGVMSARMALRRRLQREVCDQMGIPLLPFPVKCESPVGSAMGLDGYFGDGLHPNTAGALETAVAAIPGILEAVTPSFDPYALGTNILSNGGFASTNTGTYGLQPSTFDIFPIAASGPTPGSTQSCTVGTDAKGKYWDITFDQGPRPDIDPGQRLTIVSYASNTSNPLNKVCDAIAEVEVMEGYVTALLLGASATNGGTAQARSWIANHAALNAVGVTGVPLVLKTPPFLCNGDKIIWGLDFNGKGRIRLRANRSGPRILGNP